MSTSKRRFVIIGPVSRQPASLNGRILVHNSRPEMEFLFPGSEIREIGPDLPEADTMSIKDHPDLVSVQWPLRREDFR